MDDLLRKLAPISKEAWAAIDDEAKKHLTVSLRCLRSRRCPTRA